MVVFTCNNCGDSLQKPKVAKHFQFQCRGPIFLTCVDCFKDFRGDEYTVHTKCITENERYGGKDYVPKAGSNKGERKQQAWLNIVQNVLNNSKNLSGPERNLLSSITKHENIPRKKAKFINFIHNVAGNRVNMAIVESVWNKMESAFKEATTDSCNNAEKNENPSAEENQNNSNIIKENGTSTEKTNVENETKEAEKTIQKKKNSIKRQLEINENDNGEPASKKTNISEEINSISKFSWKNSIIEIVTAKGEITLKKLRKKIVAQYMASFPDSTHEKATSKFEKKLSKVSGVIVGENKVTLS